MDAFYASVEQRDDPALRGRPVAVGHPAARGVVAAASYEAREFGVRSALPSVTAARRCPDLVFVPPRFEIYGAVSRQIHAIFADYTDLIQPLSLDEAYLDVTANRRGIGTAWLTAKEIRVRIRHRLVWQEADQVASHLLPFILGTSDPQGLIVLRTNNSSAHFRGIASGGGIGILPTYARAVSRRVRPLDIGLQLRREIFSVVNADRAGDPSVGLALDWLRESFDGSRFPWFADAFIHPREFEQVISSPKVISLFEGFIDALDIDES